MGGRREQGGRQRRAATGAVRRHRIAPSSALAVLAGAAIVVLYCRHLLDRAAAGQRVELHGPLFWSVVAGFAVAALLAVACETARVVERVAGPERRLRQALRRMRGGDLGFRVALRRGDLLDGLARECNELLDWLNTNPPTGVRRGSDVVEVPAEEEERVQP